MQEEGLGVFFAPQNVALVGISTKGGNYNLLESFKSFGYKGNYYPVNPRGGSFLGEKIYRTVAEIPRSIDLAVIITPREVVLPVVQECIAQGAKGMIIITQGFADGDEEGKHLQAEIVRITQAAGVRVVGPNTMGVFNAENRFCTAFAYFEVEEKPIGVISQSGIFLPGGPFLTGGLGKAIDLGNTCDVGFAEVLSLYGADPRIKVVSLHIEDVKDGREFMRVAGEVSRQKPILALKTGKTREGAKAASSHTGSLVGEDAVYEVAFRQAGVIRVRDDEELFDLSRTFATYAPLKGNRVAVITVAGGPGILAVDACAEKGLVLAQLSPQTISRLRPLFPPWMEVGNPIDIWAAAMSRGYRQVFREALAAATADPGVDAICVITFAVRPSPQDSVLPLARELTAQKEKPVVFWFYGAHKEDYQRYFAAEGLLAFSSLEGAVGALGKLYRYGAFIQKRPAPVSKTFPVRTAELKPLLTSYEGMLPAPEVFRVLDAYGIPGAKIRFARSLEEALALAAEIGYPLVMKIASPDIIHKADAGGVRLALPNPAALCEAYSEMLTEVKTKAPGARIEGVFLQPWLAEGLGTREVLLGLKQDPCFGPVVVYGTGGIFTEVVRDVSLRVAPLSVQDAEEMIEETKSATLLKGARGQKPLDLEAVKEALLRLSQLGCDFPQIKEMDLNPVIVKEKGIVAVDARLKVAWGGKERQKNFLQEKKEERNLWRKVQREACAEKNNFELSRGRGQARER